MSIGALVTPSAIAVKFPILTHFSLLFSFEFPNEFLTNTRNDLRTIFRRTSNVCRSIWIIWFVTHCSWLDSCSWLGSRDKQSGFLVYVSCGIHLIYCWLWVRKKHGWCLWHRNLALNSKTWLWIVGWYEYLSLRIFSGLVRRSEVLRAEAGGVLSHLGIFV